MKITIIGAGVMGEIFCRALYKDFFITVCDHEQKNLKKLKDLSTKTSVGSILACQDADLVILAVKPQSFLELSKEIKGKIKNNTIVLSIMAGVSIQKIKTLLSAEKIVRAMPNLGARVGKSMTVWASKDLTVKEKGFVKKLLNLIGEEIFVDNEKMIDKATAVSGSGPGFFYYIIEQWIDSAKKLGFTDVEAKKMILKTIDGANELLQKELDPALLRGQVTSKGGTTEAGLQVLKKSQIQRILSKTMEKALSRAIELSKK